MRINLKPLNQQVIVITGATSGIGLATARMAAKAGAHLVLAARSERALGQLVAEIGKDGGHAVAVIADVSQENTAAAISAKAKEAFGGFDTWVNNAGTGVYGRIEEVSIADMRRAFEVNYWGLVYGSREAARQLKQSGGGAIINLDSEVSERSVPLQGAYSATKFAIKGFTEALRMQLENEGAPVSVTLIKPVQINTPFTVNAKNYLSSEPQHVPAVYAPEVVASAILRSATRPVRSVFVGGGGVLVSLLGRLAPGLTDKVMERFVIPGTLTDRTPRRAKDQSGLDVPTEALTTVGNYPGHVAQKLVRDVQSEPATGPWFGVRLSKRVFGVFERFPDESGRRAHLSGRGAARLMACSNALLAKPAKISKLDIIGAKLG